MYRKLTRISVTALLLMAAYPAVAAFIIQKSTDEDLSVSTTNTEHANHGRPRRHCLGETFP